MAAEKITAYRISAEDATAQAWASAQKTASSGIDSIKGMLPGLAGAFGAAGFVTLVKGSIDAMDHLNDLAKTTGLTVEALAGLKIAAKQSGGDLDSIAASVNKLAVEMGKAPEKFRELGISAKDPLEAFKQLADIWNKLEDPQQRAAVAAVALGKAWAGAAPLLAEGSKKITEMVEAGTKASGVTTEMAKQADQLNDKWELLAHSGGLVNAATASMLPGLIRATDQLLLMKEAAIELLAGKDASGGLKALKDFFTVGGGNDVVGKSLGLVKDANEARSNMRLGSGPPGGRANVDRITAADAAGNATKFLGTDKEAAARQLAEQKELAREVEQFNKEVDAAQKVALDARMKQLDDLHEAELKAARDKIELDREIEAHNKDVEQAQREAMEARQRQAEDEAAGVAKGKDVADSLRSETDLENVAYAERLANLKLYLEAKNLAQAESNELLARLQVEHEAKLGSLSAHYAKERADFQKLNAVQQAQAYIGILTTLTASTAQKNKEMFELNKIASMANAIIYTFEGANKAYAQGGIFGYAMAAAIVAAGMANVATIAGTHFGSGAAPSAGGGGPGVMPVNQVPTVPQGGSGQTTVIHVEGGDSTTISTKQIRQLFKQLEESTRDGGRIILA